MTLNFKVAIMDKETQFNINLIDVKIGLKELALATNLELDEWQRHKIMTDINDLKDLRLGLKGAFRLS
jgi:hypothetical protein